MRAHLHSKGQLLTPAWREIRQVRAKRLLQCHAENGHENIWLEKWTFCFIFLLSHKILVTELRARLCMYRVTGTNVSEGRVASNFNVVEEFVDSQNFTPYIEMSSI